MKNIFIFLFTLNCSLFVAWCHPTARKSFVIDYEHDRFLKDGKPFRYISGGIHYFRTTAYYWQDRLYKIKKAGMNAVQTYVAWNVHEPFEGDYRFTGDADLVEFIKLAQKNDLLVILRPGPYICAEWEYGGFPYWVMKKVSASGLRTHDETYMAVIEKWLSVLLQKIKPLLYQNGGPIISVQVENEYGSYGNDHVYMKQLEGIFRKYLGDEIVLFTTDGAGDWFLQRGAIPSLYTTVDFGAGGDAGKYFKVQRKYQPHGPLINSEYYTGWLDHWGEKHSRVGSKAVAESLDKILAFNASVSLYMFEGGTNFGFMNGANTGGGKLQPQPTSYDYDAPLTEAGDPTDKYFMIQKVVSKYNPIPAGPDPKPTQKVAYGSFIAYTTSSMYALLRHTRHVEHTTPLSFEDLNSPYGYVLYRTAIHSQTRGLNGKSLLQISNLHDRATILVDQVVQGILDHNYNKTIQISNGKVLDILVENLGRVNYGGSMRDTAKGILSTVTLNGGVLENWQMFPMNETALLHSAESALKEELFIGGERSRDMKRTPGVAYFSFSLSDNCCDTFLKLDAWNKGFVLVNGFNVGRYWTPLGPQRTLYVPRNILRSGLNRMLVFESDHVPMKPIVEFVEKPLWKN